MKLVDGKWCFECHQCKKIITKLNRKSNQKEQYKQTKSQYTIPGTVLIYTKRQEKCRRQFVIIQNPLGKQDNNANILQLVSMEC